MIQPVVRRCFEQQHDEDDAEHDVEPVGNGGAVGEVLAAPQRVAEDRNRGDCGRYVPRAHAVAKPARQRKQQKRQRHHEGDMDIAQRLSGDDRVGRVEMK